MPIPRLASAGALARSNGAAVFSSITVNGTSALNGAVTITAANPQLVLQGSANAIGIRMLSVAASGKYNWLIDKDVNNSSCVEICPSTATDGSTFDVPAFLVSRGYSWITTLDSSCDARLKFQNKAASGHYNWQIATGYIATNAFEITPSTATDGATFSQPSLKMTRTKHSITAVDTTSTAALEYLNVASSGKYNWIAAAGYNVANTFEITPSTAVDGATYSNPVFKATASTGAVTIGNATLGGAITFPSGCQTQAGNGTAGAPSYSFTSDPTSGILRVTGSNNLTFSANGVNAFQITSSQVLKNLVAGNESTGAGSAALGANSPAVTNTAPYTWIKLNSSDGSTVYVPVWK